MIIHPHPLNGKIAAIPSKSDAHRAIICALLSKSKCRISPIIPSKDMQATIGAISALGAKCELCGNVLMVDSSDIKIDGTPTVDCIESGSTLRFMLAVTAALAVSADFVGSGRLPQRPIDEFYNLFKAHGADMSDNHLPLRLSGGLTCGEYKISGDVSSQFITGLLLALPILDGDSRITLTTKLESKPYVDMTIGVMKKFGVIAVEDDKGYIIKGNQQYHCDEYIVDGDWSQAAFFLCGGAIGGNISMSGLDMDSTQGDKQIFDIIKAFGGDISSENGLVISKKSALHGCDVDASQIPDLVPIIAVMAANASGKSRIYGAQRLRYKESDRIKSVIAALNEFGVEVSEQPDGMIINGGINGAKTAKIDCCNDHRIAMAFSVMGAYSDTNTQICGHECVNKSYPAFFEDFAKLQED